MRFTETGLRSFAKMVSWRVSATLTTMILVYIFVRRIDIAASVGGLEVIAKMILYYVHERAWDRVKRGRREAAPCVLWFTGLPKCGKRTLADRTYSYLLRNGYKVQRLEGNTIRHLFPETGYSREDRNNHMQKVGLVASMLEKNGVIVVASFISPYKESRDFIRKLCKNFIEVYVSAPIEVCERRDDQGLYKQARAGRVPNFTGVSDPYEVPEQPDLTLDTGNQTIEQSFERVRDYLRKCL